MCMYVCVCAQPGEDVLARLDEKNQIIRFFTKENPSDDQDSLTAAVSHLKSPYETI